MLLLPIRVLLDSFQFVALYFRHVLRRDDQRGFGIPIPGGALPLQGGPLFPESFLIIRVGAASTVCPLSGFDLFSRDGGSGGDT